MRLNASGLRVSSTWEIAIQLLLLLLLLIRRLEMF
jgi:hypothetical protein